MLETERVNATFADARLLYDDALEQLEAGKLRNAAEKASGATKRATDALILARTGEEPRTAGRTLRELRRADSAFDSLEGRYNTRANVLHGECFYDGNCEPEDVLARDVRETLDYIRDAEALARV
ncbi:MAG: hypothetical protein J4F46_09515 [Dehalococcoidia bacterium]|nr:hypothetical protein [Dehalococcoidia bacterium]